MSRSSDYFRQMGYTDEQITSMSAERDQHSAEADHLIDHAVRLQHSTFAAGTEEAAAIRSHLAGHDERHLRGVLACLLSRAGQLATTVTTMSEENARLTAALAAAQEGQE